MPNNDCVRVLNRRGARQLTLEETERITGSNNKMNTVATDLMTGTPVHPDFHHDE